MVGYLAFVLCFVGGFVCGVAVVLYQTVRLIIYEPDIADRLAVRLRMMGNGPL